MPRKNQPKSQRGPKVPAAMKKTMRNVVRQNGEFSFVMDNLGPIFKQEPEEPVQRILSWGSGYGWAGMHPTDLTAKIKKAVDYFGVLRSKIKIDAIAYTGSSGAALAFPLAIAHDVPVIYIRKDGERSHGTEVECNCTQEIENYIIVDDFIATGSTVRRIMTKIKERAKYFSWDGPECMGVLIFDPQTSGQTARFELQDENYEKTGEVVDVFIAP